MNYRDIPRIRISFEQRFEQVKALLSVRPHSAQELNSALGYSGTNAIHHLLSELKKQKQIGIVDWHYTGGQRMSPLYGLGDHNLTREDFFKRNGISENKKTRRTTREKDPIASFHSKPRPAPIRDVIPTKVKESFKNGASIVVIEGKKYENTTFE